MPVTAAQRSYDEAGTDIPPEVRSGLKSDLDQAKAKLDTAVRAELELREEKTHGPFPSGQHRTNAATSLLKTRYKADEGDTALLDGSLDRIANTRHQEKVREQARSIVSTAKDAGEPPEQMAKLEASLKAAPQEVREAVLKDKGYDELLQSAADWAMEPLQGGDAREAEKQFHTPMAAGTQAGERLEQVTARLSPERAAALTSKAMPTIEAFSSSCNEHYPTLMSPFAGDGFRALMKVMDRGADTPQGINNMKKLAEQDVWDRSAMSQHISDGGKPGYALLWGGVQGIDMSALRTDIAYAMAPRIGDVKKTAEEFSAHMSEIGWLVANHGAAMTPEQLQRAIKDYTENKGPEWEKKGKELQAKLAVQGAALQDELVILGHLPADAPGREAAITEILNDPASQLALTTAWEQKPQLLEGARAEGLLEMLSDPTVRGSAKLTDTGLRTIAHVGTTYVQHQIKSFQGFNPKDDASVARLNKAMERLQSPALAKYMGVKPSSLAQAVVELRKLTPRAGDTLDIAEARLKSFNSYLQSGEGLGSNFGLRLSHPETGAFGLYEAKGGIGAFDKGTLAGQVLRGAGVGLAVAGLAGSTAVLMTQEKTPDRVAKVLVDAAGLTNKGTELAIARGKFADSK